jgi:hypothetical protein
MNKRKRLPVIVYGILFKLSSWQPAIFRNSCALPAWKEEDLLPERGAELKVNLEVEEDSPLEPRTFRNHFEHFDLRLEQWAISMEPRRCVDSNIASPGMISSIEPGDYLRHFPQEFRHHVSGR